jgi:phosphohistidine phosphatase
MYPAATSFNQAGVIMSDRTLVLLRHAKAAHSEGVADLKRALTPRGHADAAVAGGWLAGQRLFPDLVLCSPARRTRETWHGVAIALGPGATATTVAYDPVIYDADDAEELRDLLAATAPDVSTLLVIGHNPTVSTLSALLDPAADEDGLRTCGLAVHRVPGAWRDLPAGAPLTTAHTARA